MFSVFIYFYSAQFDWTRFSFISLYSIERAFDDIRQISVTLCQIHFCLYVLFCDLVLMQIYSFEIITTYTLIRVTFEWLNFAESFLLKSIWRQQINRDNNIVHCNCNKWIPADSNTYRHNYKYNLRVVDDVPKTAFQRILCRHRYQYWRNQRSKTLHVIRRLGWQPGTLLKQMHT